MKEQKEIGPPAWAERLLSWYCRSELVEDLQGDLNEYFLRNLKSRGVRKARLIYIIDVFKFMRLYTIRKPDFVNLLINWIMLGSYIKTSGRNIVRNKLFSTINIFGLAVSMTVGLLLIAMLSDLVSYDQFHNRHRRIYRVISQYQYMDHKDEDFLATTSLRAGKAIKETFAGVEDVAILKLGLGGDVTFGEKTISLSGFWANEALFNVFSFKLLQGNPATALKQPFSIVLTETSALKLFGDVQVLGKVIKLNHDRDYTVTGIVQDVPKFSHIKFDMLGSLGTREITQKENRSEMEWDNVWNTWVYLLLPDHADIPTVRKSLDQLSAKEDKSVKYTHIELDLQPMDDIMIGANLSNQIGQTIQRSTVWILAALAFVVILSACLNYTNLSVARALRRTREVGIRKVIGAMKGQVVGQFVVEAIIISLCALGIAFILFLLLKPFFLSIEPSLQKLLLLELSPLLLLYFIAFAVVVGCAAGFFPAIFFARINTVQVLKNFSSVQLFGKVTLRKVLIVFQYCISIIFITATIVGYNQYKHFIAYDLGFSTENVLNISLKGNKAELIEKELQELPEVRGISRSLMITSVGDYWGTSMKYAANPDDSSSVNFNTVDENYLPLHNHKLLAGRNFEARPDSAEESEVIVNQSVLKRFNIANQDSEKAIGEIVKVDGKDLRIVGVMKNFVYGKANDKKKDREVVFRYSNKNADFLNVKLESSDLLATHTRLEAIWKKIDSVHPFEAKFYDEELEQAFDGLKASVKVAGFMAFLAICISSLGLLGMVVFTTETRLKEISIRKVMGASDGKLLYLLGKGFVVLLAVAIGIAVPLTIIFFEEILFPNLANHAPLDLIGMLMGVAAVLVIALVMIGAQTFKVANANPAEVLKNE